MKFFKTTKIIDTQKSKIEQLKDICIKYAVATFTNIPYTSPYKLYQEFSIIILKDNASQFLSDLKEIFPDNKRIKNYQVPQGYDEFSINLTLILGEEVTDELIKLKKAA